MVADDASRSYERIARAAKCCRDSVCVAIAALEDAGLLTWVHRITRIRRRERDLLGELATTWQVIRTSNGYRFLDPLDREPGRRGYKSENPSRPQNQEKNLEGAPLVAAQVMQTGATTGPPEQTETLLALQREHDHPPGAL